MATRLPTRRPVVRPPWQKNFTPPSSSTSAMCSGEAKPVGGEWSVVKASTSP